MQQIGEYLVGRIIGEGGMGKVYEAEERLSRRRVALKVLRQDLAQSEDGRRLFLREMKILSHIDHPNVVRCLTNLEADGQLVMVLEHLDGQTLRDLLRHETRLPWPRVVSMAKQITAGLGAAHGQSNPIVHRDLKPENIMVLVGDLTKVMDFGIAKILDALPSKTVHTLGTLQYMSPEQIEGRTPDPRADLYCLGLVLYEMLSGHPPFASESPRKLLNLQCTQPPPRLPPQQPPLPPALEQLVYALLEKDPDRRPPNADVVLRQLAQLESPVAQPAAGAAVTPPGPPMAARGTPMAAAAPDPPRSMGTIMLVEKAGQAQQRRDKAGLFVAIGAVVVVALGVGGYLLIDLGGEPEADEQTEVPPAATPTPQVKAPAKSSTAEEAEARAREIREKAEAERAAAETGAGESAAGDPPPKPEADSDGGEPPAAGSDDGGISGLFGRIKRDDEPGAQTETGAETKDDAGTETEGGTGADRPGIFDILGRKEAGDSGSADGAQPQ